MSLRREGGSCSPDPLAASQYGSFSSGAKVSTPRKPLGMTTGNQQAHQISITTPKSRNAKRASPKKINESKELEASPWRIRITVQAQQENPGETTSLPQCSPSKIFTERTFTTKVPLKDSDNALPVRRKVKETPRKRRSSPAPARSTSRSRTDSLPRANATPPVNDISSVSPLIPKRGRGRPRKSTVSPKSTSATESREKIGENPGLVAHSSEHDPDHAHPGTQEQSGDSDRGLDDEPQGMDSVLESEGFSMVSVSSLASAQSASGKEASSRTAMNALSISPTKRHVTPSITQHSPVPPSSPKPVAVMQSCREIDKPTAGTPRLARVVRAGIALQGVLSPANQRRGAQQSSRINSSSPLSGASSPIARLDDLFSGFGPGTQRELRAGLRLGEELAKRQNSAAGPPDRHHDVQADGNVFAASTEISYPQLPDTGAAAGYCLKIPGSPSFSNNQLPSPARSEVGADDDRMSWKYDTLPQCIAAPYANKEVSAIANSPIGLHHSKDHTMLAREAEWQREREAVSRQIQEANPSQVIVIHSDDEDDDGGADSAQADPEDDADIWQQEAQNSSTDHSTSDVPPIFRQTEAPKPRRSQLPSPWMQKTRDVSQISLPTSGSDPFCPKGQVEEPLESSQTGMRSNRQDSPISTPTHVNDRIKEWGTFDKEMTQEDESRRNDDCSEFDDQEQDSGSPFSDENPGSDLLSQQSMQYDLTAPLDEGTEIHSSVSITSTDDIFEEEVPEPQTPLPRTPASSKPKTPKQVRFSEELTRPPQPKLSAPQPAPLPPAPSSWLSRVTSLLPTWGTTAPAAVPLPSVPKRTVHLSKVDRGPLPVYMPWQQCHWWALIHIVRQSQADPTTTTTTTFSYPSNTTAAASYLGAVVSVNKWSKKITKRDCAVAERFRHVLRERGTLKGIEKAALEGEPRTQWGKVPGQIIDLDVVFSAVTAQWACDVQDGVCQVGWGDRAGLRQGSEREVWTKVDLAVDGPGVVYVV
ncbi:MAG: hypothetical protein Q9219_001668 [cf. Caloplaca sp. 3 TL-2023]